MKKIALLTFLFSLSIACLIPSQVSACTTNAECVSIYGPGYNCNLSNTCVNGVSTNSTDASSNTSSGTIGGLINQVIGLINAAVPLIFALAFIVFLWGVFNYFIAGAGNDEKRKEGRGFIIYALIGFVVMVSVWGIVNLLSNSFTFGSKTRPNLPTFDSGTAK